jgi:ABC-type methionine transport system ATPase subunit
MTKMANKRILIKFTQELLKEPIIYSVSSQFNVITNIQRANIAEECGWAEVELIGEAVAINESIDWMMGRGLRVEVISGED